MVHVKAQNTAHDPKSFSKLFQVSGPKYKWLTNAHFDKPKSRKKKK